MFVYPQNSYVDILIPIRVSLVAQIIKNLPAIQETQVQSLGCEDPLEKTMATNPLQYSCLENSMNKGSRQATFHGVTKSGHD